MIPHKHFGRVYFLRAETGTCPRCGQLDPNTPVDVRVGEGSVTAWEVSPSRAVACVEYGDFDVARLLPADVWLTREEAEAALAKEPPDAR